MIVRRWQANGDEKAEEVSAGRAYRHRSVSARTFLRGVLEVSGWKPRRWIFQFQRRWQTVACWDRAHTYHVQNIPSHLLGHTLGFWVYLLAFWLAGGFISREMCAMCRNIQVFCACRWAAYLRHEWQKRESLSSLSITSSCLIGLYFGAGATQENRRLCSCNRGWLLNSFLLSLGLKQKADVACRNSQDSYCWMYTFHWCSACLEHFSQTHAKQEMKRIQEKWCDTSLWKLFGIVRLGQRYAEFTSRYVTLFWGSRPGMIL